MTMHPAHNTLTPVGAPSPMRGTGATIYRGGQQEFIGGILKGVGRLLPGVGGIIDTIETVGDVIRNRGGSGGTAAEASDHNPARCPSGWRSVQGRCVPGLPTLAPRPPQIPVPMPTSPHSPVVSGPTGSYGEGAVIGAFGVPAIIPTPVGEVANARGEVNPIFRCPPGAVLGKDNLCYMKGSIPRQFRKWKPSARPPMTAADAKALRRIATLQKKVKRLATNAGLTTRKR